MSGSSLQSEEKPATQGGGNVTQSALKEGEKLVLRIPIVDDLTFWLAVNSLAFLFVGGSQIAWGYNGIDLALSIGALLVGLGYGYLALARSRKKESWVVTVAILLPAVIIVIDALVRSWLPGPTLLIIVVSGLLLHSAYVEMRSQARRT